MLPLPFFFHLSSILETFLCFDYLKVIDFLTLTCPDVDCFVGKIKTVALTNFDTERLHTILENGIPVVSNQVNNLE